MNRILFLLLNLLLAGAVSSQPQKAFAARVDSLIHPLVHTNNYSGVVAVDKNGAPLFSKAYGEMNREYGLKNTSDTKFFLASLSMVFTSAAVMKLTEEGKLALTDPISTFIPDYKHGTQITVHDLLSQRSGIPAIGTSGNVAYDSITKFAHSIEKLYSYFKDYELLYKPGARYNHGRSDYILLAAIIEKVTGKTFGQYLNEAVFAPLRMTNTGHYTSEKEIISNLAKGYAPKGLYEVESAYGIDWSSKTGHASIYSTASDLQRFAQAALDGRLLTKESWKKIFTNYGDNVGYGWFISGHLNRERFQMNGRSPGFSSYLGIYPQEKLVVVVLSNNYIPLPAEVGKSLAALALNEPFEGLPLTDKPVSADVAKKFIGTYKFGENFYRPNYELVITHENGRLVSDWGGLIPLAKGPNNFNEFVLRTYWSSVRFVADANGKVTGMRFDAHEGTKIK